MAQPKNPENVRRGRSARAKGAQGEREVCHILSELTGEEFQRILGQARDSGSDVRYGPFLLEVKRHERLCLPQWQEQAKASAQEAGKIPAVVYRQNREDWWISVPLRELVLLLEGLRNAAKGRLPGPLEAQDGRAEGSGAAGQAEEAGA